jgi:pyridoxine kinase
VVRGSVGNRAAVFALETLGHTVWAVPTVVLPWHPGHGLATRIVPEPERFYAMLLDIEESPWLGEVAGVVSGYVGGPEQVAAIASLVRRVKLKNRNAVYLCDPVIGDKGGLYVNESIATQMRDRLLPLADIATPNRYELAWLAGTSLDGAEQVARAAEALGPPTMLVTSAPCEAPGTTGTMLLAPGEALLAEHHEIANPPNGLGDLTAALFLARRLEGQGNAEALQHTTAAVFEVLARAAKRGADELMLAADANSLSHPPAPVHLTRLRRPASVR